MSVYRTVSEIFSVKNGVTLKPGVRGRSRSLKMVPAIAAILFYWIRMKVVQQLTGLTLGRPNGSAYSTGELLNTLLNTAQTVSQKPVSQRRQLG